MEQWLEVASGLPLLPGNEQLPAQILAMHAIALPDETQVMWFMLGHFRETIEGMSVVFMCWEFTGQLIHNA